MIRNFHLKSAILAASVSMFFAAQLFSIGNRNIKVQIQPDVIGEVSPEYLSVAIDLALIVQGQWWQDEAPVRLDGPELKEAAKLLSPAWIRIGGTEADNVYYDNSPTLTEYTPLGYGSKIRPESFRQLGNLLDASNNKLMYTLNAGPGPRSSGQWEVDQLSNLIMDFPFLFSAPSLFELGNEVGSFWFSHGFRNQISWETYGQNYDYAKDYLHQLNPNYQLAGPANAFWPFLGEPGSTVFGSSFGFLKNHEPDIFTWHYYPTQSKRCPVRTLSNSINNLLETKLYRETHRQAQWIKEQRDLLSPNSVLWLGETGPAQCGGEPGTSDRFVNSLWWLSHLGIMAQYDNQVIIRQSLIGSDYGLLRHEDLSPNPDFYASVLWKKVMGTKVLKVEDVGDDSVLAFAHCGRDSNQPVVLLVNLDDSSVIVKPEGITFSKMITGTGLDLNSHTLKINNQLAETFHKLNLILPWSPIVTKEILIPAYSWNFISVDMNTSANPCE